MALHSAVWENVRGPYYGIVDGEVHASATGSATAQLLHDQPPTFVRGERVLIHAASGDAVVIGSIEVDTNGCSSRLAVVPRAAIVHIGSEASAASDSHQSTGISSSTRNDDALVVAQKADRVQRMWRAHMRRVLAVGDGQAYARIANQESQLREWLRQAGASGGSELDSAEPLRPHPAVARERVLQLVDAATQVSEGVVAPRTDSDVMATDANTDASALYRLHCETEARLASGIRVPAGAADAAAQSLALGAAAGAAMPRTAAADVSRSFGVPSGRRGGGDEPTSAAAWWSGSALPTVGDASASTVPWSTWPPNASSGTPTTARSIPGGDVVQILIEFDAVASAAALRGQPVEIYAAVYDALGGELISDDAHVFVDATGQLAPPPCTVWSPQSEQQVKLMQRMQPSGFSDGSTNPAMDSADLRRPSSIEGSTPSANGTLAPPNAGPTASLRAYGDAEVHHEGGGSLIPDHASDVGNDEKARAAAPWCKALLLHVPTALIAARRCYIVFRAYRLGPLKDSAAAAAAAAAASSTATAASSPKHRIPPERRVQPRDRLEGSVESPDVSSSDGEGGSDGGDTSRLLKRKPKQRARGRSNSDDLAVQGSGVASPRVTATAFSVISSLFGLRRRTDTAVYRRPLGVTAMRVPPALLALPQATPHAPAESVPFYRPAKADADARFGGLYRALVAEAIMREDADVDAAMGTTGWGTAATPAPGGIATDDGMASGQMRRYFPPSLPPRASTVVGISATPAVAAPASVGSAPLLPLVSRENSTASIASAGGSEPPVAARSGASSTGVWGRVSGSGSGATLGTAGGALTGGSGAAVLLLATSGSASNVAPLGSPGSQFVRAPRLRSLPVVLRLLTAPHDELAPLPPSQMPPTVRQPQRRIPPPAPGDPTFAALFPPPQLLPRARGSAEPPLSASPTDSNDTSSPLSRLLLGPRIAAGFATPRPLGWAWAPPRGISRSAPAEPTPVLTRSTAVDPNTHAHLSIAPQRPPILSTISERDGDEVDGVDSGPRDEHSHLGTAGASSVGVTGGFGSYDIHTGGGAAPVVVTSPALVGFRSDRDVATCHFHSGIAGASAQVQQRHRDSLLLRDELYVTLRRGVFYQDGKISPRNVQTRVNVLLENGDVLPCIFRGTNGDWGGAAKNVAVPEYRSTVLYHCNTPVYDETITIRLADSEQFARAHLLFSFWHASSQETRTHAFAFAFLPLADSGGTAIHDGRHSLRVYKVLSGMETGLRPPAYLVAPVTDSGGQQVLPGVPQPQPQQTLPPITHLPQVIAERGFAHPTPVESHTAGASDVESRTDTSAVAPSGGLASQHVGDIEGSRSITGSGDAAGSSRAQRHAGLSRRPIAAADAPITTTECTVLTTEHAAVARSRNLPASAMPTPLGGSTLLLNSTVSPALQAGGGVVAVEPVALARDYASAAAPVSEWGRGDAPRDRNLSSVSAADSVATSTQAMPTPTVSPRAHPIAAPYIHSSPLQVSSSVTNAPGALSSSSASSSWVTMMWHPLEVRGRDVFEVETHLVSDFKTSIPELHVLSEWQTASFDVLSRALHHLPKITSDASQAMHAVPLLFSSLVSLLESFATTIADDGTVTRQASLRYPPWADAEAAHVQPAAFRLLIIVLDALFSQLRPAAAPAAGHVPSDDENLAWPPAPSQRVPRMRPPIAPEYARLPLLDVWIDELMLAPRVHRVLLPMLIAVLNSAAVHAGIAPNQRRSPQAAGGIYHAGRASTFRWSRRIAMTAMRVLPILTRICVASVQQEQACMNSDESMLWHAFRGEARHCLDILASIASSAAAATTSLSTASDACNYAIAVAALALRDIIPVSLQFTLYVTAAEIAGVVAYALDAYDDDVGYDNIVSSLPGAADSIAISSLLLVRDVLRSGLLNASDDIRIAEEPSHAMNPVQPRAVPPRAWDPHAILLPRLVRRLLRHFNETGTMRAMCLASAGLLIAQLETRRGERRRAGALPANNAPRASAASSSYASALGVCDATDWAVASLLSELAIATTDVLHGRPALGEVLLASAARRSVGRGSRRLALGSAVRDDADAPHDNSLGSVRLRIWRMREYAALRRAYLASGVTEVPALNVAAVLPRAPQRSPGRSTPASLRVSQSFSTKAASLSEVPTFVVPNATVRRRAVDREDRGDPTRVLTGTTPQQFSPRDGVALPDDVFLEVYGSVSGSALTPGGRSALGAAGDVSLDGLAHENPAAAAAVTAHVEVSVRNAVATFLSLVAGLPDTIGPLLLATLLPLHHNRIGLRVDDSSTGQIADQEKQYQIDDDEFHRLALALQMLHTASALLAIPVFPTPWLGMHILTHGVVFRLYRWAAGLLASSYTSAEAPHQDARDVTRPCDVAPWRRAAPLWTAFSDLSIALLTSPLLSPEAQAPLRRDALRARIGVPDRREVVCAVVRSVWGGALLRGGAGKSVTVTYGEESARSDRSDVSGSPQQARAPLLLEEHDVYILSHHAYFDVTGMGAADEVALRFVASITTNAGSPLHNVGSSLLHGELQRALVASPIGLCADARLSLAPRLVAPALDLTHCVCTAVAALARDIYMDLVRAELAQTLAAGVSTNHHIASAANPAAAAALPIIQRLTIDAIDVLVQRRGPTLVLPSVHEEHSVSAAELVDAQTSNRRRLRPFRGSTSGRPQYVPPKDNLIMTLFAPPPHGSTRRGSKVADGNHGHVTPRGELEAAGTATAFDGDSGGDAALLSHRVVRRFLGEIRALYALLSSVGKYPTGADGAEWEEERAGAALALIGYLRRTHRLDLYTKYVAYLAHMHDALGNAAEAAFARLLHADVLDWSTVGPRLPPVSFAGEEVLPAAPHAAARLEAVLAGAVTELTSAGCWEEASRLGALLAERYEHVTAEYSKLAHTLRGNAARFEAMARESRLYPSYFLVTYGGGRHQGVRFPRSLRRRMAFVYRGGLGERIIDFEARLLGKWGDAGTIRKVPLTLSAGIDLVAAQAVGLINLSAASATARSKFSALHGSGSDGARAHEGGGVDWRSVFGYGDDGDEDDDDDCSESDEGVLGDCGATGADPTSWRPFEHPSGTHDTRAQRADARTMGTTPSGVAFAGPCVSLIAVSVVPAIPRHPLFAPDEIMDLGSLPMWLGMERADGRSGGDHPHVKVALSPRGATSATHTSAASAPHPSATLPEHSTRNNYAFHASTLTFSTIGASLHGAHVVQPRALHRTVLTSHNTLGITDENADVIRITPVQLPALVRVGREHAGARFFMIARPFRVRSERSSSEVLDTWVSRIYVATAEAFPSAHRRSPVLAVHEVTLNPLEAAVMAVRDKTAVLIDVIERSSAGPDHGAEQDFSSKLAGVVDAAVSGGVANYTPFLTGAFASSHPEIADDMKAHGGVKLVAIDALRDALVEQVRVVARGIRVHAVKCAPGMEGLHAHMCVRFEQMQQSLRALGVFTKH